MGWSERSHAYGCIRKAAVLGTMFLVLSVSTACSSVEQTSSMEGSGAEEPFFGAALIDDSNRDLIGATIQADSSSLEILGPGETSSPNLTDAERWDALAESDVIQGPASPDLPPPGSITEFFSKDGMTPEIIMTNGVCAVFSPDGEDGWLCEAGEQLSFAYESYYSYSHSLTIGYIKDGVMYAGEGFHDLSGAYELEIQESGTYQIYVISAASDYLALKEGLITVK